MSYRFDKRTKEQFAENIAECTKIERKLMEVYVQWLNSGGGKCPTGSYSFSDNGVDNTGKYLEDKQVHSGADFILHTKDKPNKPIEIKFSRPDTYSFHIKVPHIKSCLNNNVCLVMFMGTETDKTRFTILTPKLLEDALNTKPIKRMWQKDCIRFNNSELKWENVILK